MGLMCSNPLQYLIEEYGADVGKFVVVQKTQEFFDEKFPEVKKELADKTKVFQEETLKSVNEQSDSGLTKITGNINEFKTSKKTEIQAFESISGKKFDEVVGANDITSKFNDIKQKSKEQMAGVQTTILSQADTLASKQKQVIASQKPSIPAFDSLPQCLKDKVLVEGEKQFAPQISQQKNKAQEFFNTALNFDQMKKKFAGNLPTDQIKGLNEQFDSKLSDAKNLINLQSGGGLGKIGGFL